MRWFIDTEFHEDGHIIELISIALVSEDGHEYYAVSNEFDEGRCSDWLHENVLPNLPVDGRISRKKIASDIEALLFQHSDPEIWGYFSDYDWVVFCQLFGSMINLPAFIPQYCLDLKQEMHLLGLTKHDLPRQKGAAHDALADARWIREAWLHIYGLPKCD